MELATGKPDFNFSTTVKHLYVEQRELAKPVTLFYPTFASAADAAGMSRIWAGVHWPADNERGLELGRKVGENVWLRAQQFMLGTASPATAAFAALRPPYWFYNNEAPDHPAHFDAASGLAIDLPPHGVGAWRSVVADPMPTGAYGLELRGQGDRRSAGTAQGRGQTGRETTSRFSRSDGGDHSDDRIRRRRDSSVHERRNPILPGVDRSERR
jgi:hypothetical protein